MWVAVFPHVIVGEDPTEVAPAWHGGAHAAGKLGGVDPQEPGAWGQSCNGPGASPKKQGHRDPHGITARENPAQRCS